MFKFMGKKLAKVGESRGTILVFVFCLLAFALVQRLFQLQIVKGESYLTDFTMKIKKERTIKSTRGEIYDRNGYGDAPPVRVYAIKLYRSSHPRCPSAKSYLPTGPVWVSPV